MRKRWISWMARTGDRRMAAAVIAVGMAACGGATAPAASAASPGTNGVVVVSTDLANGNGPPSLYILSRLGNGFRQITSHQWAVAPAFAPDGKVIAYNDSRAIKVITVTGTPVRTVVTDGYHPSWSPSGSTIAFSRGGVLYAVPSTGGTATKLTSPPAGCADALPAWSPAGGAIAFQRTCGATGSVDLLTLATGGVGVLEAGIHPMAGALTDPGLDWLPGGTTVVTAFGCPTSGRCDPNYQDVIGINIRTKVRSVLVDATTYFGGPCQPNSDCNSGFLAAAAGPDGKDFLVTYWAASGGSVICMEAVHARLGLCNPNMLAANQGVYGMSWQPR